VAAQRDYIYYLDQLGTLAEEPGELSHPKIMVELIQKRKQTYRLHE
jgi:hypothetical protein